MEFYKNKIIETNRHQIIFGFENKDLLKELEKEYPIKADEDIPMAIYLDEIGFPDIEDNKPNQMKLTTISREYLNFVIAEKIIENITLQLDLKTIEKRLEKYLSSINSLRENKITNLNELLILLNKSKQFYINYYNEYVKNQTIDLNIEDLDIPFLGIEFFIRRIKELLNNNSYFVIILDNEEPLSLLSKQTINRLISCRINGKLSVKLVTTKENWNTYYTDCGDLIENVHDYETVDINSYQKVLTRLK